ncbi:MAG: ABC transporter permease [Kiritimatiellaeota bacterium]|nr:ABC transporter permease [Kiritimatiellota bacterium]
MNPVFLIARKEAGRLLLDQWALAWLLAFSAVLSGFALLLVSNAELSLLDNAQVVYMMAGTVMSAGAIVAVILGCDAFAGERERCTLTPLLLAPVSSRELLLGKALGVSAAWGAAYLLAMPYLWAVGAGGQDLVQAIVYLALFGTPVVLGFGCLAMAFSAKTGNVITSLVTSLIILLLAASPLLIGPGLRGTVIGRMFDALNPFAAALNTFDAVVIDNETFTKQLVRLTVTFVWLGITFAVAYCAARRPRFR